MMNPQPHTIVCAWCRKTMQHGSLTVSHGICEQCTMAFRPGQAQQPSALRTAQEFYRQNQAPPPPE